MISSGRKRKLVLLAIGNGERKRREGKLLFPGKERNE
jgi:hypothetical protein